VPGLSDHPKMPAGTTTKEKRCAEPDPGQSVDERSLQLRGLNGRGRCTIEVIVHNDRCPSRPGGFNLFPEHIFSGAIIALFQRWGFNAIVGIEKQQVRSLQRGQSIAEPASPVSRALDRCTGRCRQR
jgi:hypothetical protein